MLKERRAAVDAVANAFLPTEEAVESAAALGARCIAVMIEERKKANLPLDTGADAFDLIVEGTMLALSARSKFLAAHPELAKLPAEIGVSVKAYGDEGCPPNSAELRHPPLRSVA